MAWIPIHVGIRGSEKANIPAKKALNMEITNIRISHTDFKKKVKDRIKSEWYAKLNIFLRLSYMSVSTENINITDRREDTVQVSILAT